MPQADATLYYRHWFEVNLETGRIFRPANSDIRPAPWTVHDHAARWGGFPDWERAQQIMTSEVIAQLNFLEMMPKLGDNMWAKALSTRGEGKMWIDILSTLRWSEKVLLRTAQIVYNKYKKSSVDQAIEGLLHV